MNSHLRRIPLFLLCAALASAEPPGIDQSMEFVIPTTGAKFIRWQGKLGRTYFIMVSDPADHLRVWHYAPVMEGGNDLEISHEVDGTADKGFFRLHYTDQPTSNPYLADFDHDGISNSFEVEEVGSDPFNSASVGADTDNDGMPDWWENLYGLNPNNPADANGYLVADGVTNLVKYKTGRNPKVFALADSTGTLPLKVHTPLE
jgi:Bacterial TSP3 repeat